MKFAIFIAALFAVAFARPQSPDQSATIVIQKVDISPDGSQYAHSSQTSNGIQAQEQAQLQPASTPEESPSYAAQGQYSHIGPDGVEYTVTYTADKNGFHPSGKHLPVAPAA